MNLTIAYYIKIKINYILIPKMSIGFLLYIFSPSKIIIQLFHLNVESFSVGKNKWVFSCKLNTRISIAVFCVLNRLLYSQIMWNYYKPATFLNALNTFNWIYMRSSYKTQTKQNKKLIINFSNKKFLLLMLIYACVCNVYTNFVSSPILLYA